MPLFVNLQKAAIMTAVEELIFSPFCPYFFKTAVLPSAILLSTLPKFFFFLFF
jgi:hypothetical protein